MAIQPTLSPWVIGFAVVGAAGLSYWAISSARYETPADRRVRLREERANLRSVRRGERERIAEDRRELAAQKARSKVLRLEAQHDRADARDTPAGDKQAARLQAKIAKVEALADRIKRGDYTPAEIRDLMASGQLRFKNPASSSYDDACQLAEAFQGDCKIGRLSTREQAHYGLPEYVAVVGPVEALAYRKSGEVYEHLAGDTGSPFGKKRGTTYLVADPRDAEPALIPGRMRLESRGLVG